MVVGVSVVVLVFFFRSLVIEEGMIDVVRRKKGCV